MSVDLSAQHPATIDDAVLASLIGAPVVEAEAVRRLLMNLAKNQTTLRAGFTRAGQAESGVIRTVGSNHLTLDMAAFEVRDRRQVFFRFRERDHVLFFASRLISFSSKDQLLEVGLPTSFSRAERRFEPRARAVEGRAIEIALDRGQQLIIRLLDTSPCGFSARLPPTISDIPYEFRARTESGWRYCKLRRQRPGTQGSTEIGVSLSEVPSNAPLEIQRRSETARSPRQQARLAGAAAKRALKSVFRRPEAGEAQRLAFIDSRGWEIAALIDSVGCRHDAPTLIIPPAWGKTKETLLPLAETILATFGRAGEPVNVVRFDGTNRRGESHKAPRCQERGLEHLRFSFSDAVRDVEEVVSALVARGHPRGSFVLVTFSAAAVEGRRVMARDTRGSFAGWISVVGMPDLQFALRETSGGLDYLAGCAAGVSFGLQEVLGVLVDMDYCAPDALSERLAFLEHARSDMAQISQPVTWIHGLHDAWMDRARVEELMRSGGSAPRRLIEVPTGHQLRSSAEALATFELVASEVSEIACGRRLNSKLPDLRRLEAKTRQEREAAKSTREVSPADLWADYVLGRDRVLGFDLLSATQPYRAMMQQQLRHLGQTNGQRVLDLGAGTGGLAREIEQTGRTWPSHLVEIDILGEALRRSPARELPDTAHALVADATLSIPLRSGSVSSVVASLLLNYIPIDPALEEIARVLRPGGRLVLSCLKPDAEIGAVFKQGIQSLSQQDAVRLFGSAGRDHLESAQLLLNDAAKIFDLEEAGVFSFYSEAELRLRLRRAGFRSLRLELGLGDPGQAIVGSAIVAR